MQLRSGKVISAPSFVYPVLGFTWPSIGDAAARSKKCSSQTELLVHLQRLLNSSSVVNSRYASRLCILAALETLLDSDRQVIPDRLLYTVFDKLDEGCVYEGNPPDLYKYIHNAKRVLGYPWTLVCTKKV